VLLVRLGEQPFAVPLSMVREILPIEPGGIQDVGGKATMVVRGEVLPIVPLSDAARLAARGGAAVWRADAVGRRGPSFSRSTASPGARTR
jgi:chemotaxis protein histidine kinase CheA